LKSLNGGVRGILRTPQRLYSNDPNKVAAGTHLATPPGKRASMLNLNKDLPAAPATAPVRKHVDFSHSTKEREISKSSTPPRDPADIAMEDDTESLASPTPRHPAIQPELKPTEAIAYPSLAPSSPLARPIIQPRSISKSARRQTLGPMTTTSVPGSFPADFTFRAGSEVPVSFASPSPVRGRTIRAVRNSDGPSFIASVTNSPSKRKFKGLGNFAEENEVEIDAEAAASDKENFAVQEAQVEEVDRVQDMRSAKRIKKSSPEPELKSVKKQVSAPSSRLPQQIRKGKRGSVLSRSRLDMLSMPKKR